MMRPTLTGVDIKLFAGALLIVGMMDLIIILLFPAYALRLFGTAVEGPASCVIKLHSPAVHLLAGYGFLWLRPWAWGLSLAYAGFVIVSETMNQLAFGFHVGRSGFMATTALFVGYLWWRRHLFADQPRATTPRPFLSEG